MIYLLSDPLFAYGIATFSVLLALARVLHERRKSSGPAKALARQLDASENEVRRLNRLLRERDARIEDGKADNRNQSQIIKEQARKIRTTQKLLDARTQQVSHYERVMDRLNNIIDFGYCNDPQCGKD